jgi:hypothetical protein
MAINPPRQRNTLHLGAVLSVPKHLGCGDHAGMDDFVIVVNIMQKMIQSANALFESGLQLRPLSGGYHPRNHVKRNETLGTRIISVDREGDSDPAKGKIGLGSFLNQPVGGLRL